MTGRAGVDWVEGQRDLDERMVRMCRAWLVVGFVLTAVHATGVVGDSAYTVLALASPVLIVVGARRNRPEPMWPWIVLVVAAVLFTVAAVVRANVGATGDLSSHRSLLPDTLALPGYVAFAVALLALLRARISYREHAVTLDAAILSLGSLVVAWVVLLDPVLSRQDAAPIAKFAIIMYPPISVFLVSVAARLYFASGQRSTSYRLLLAGMATLLMGDVVFVPVEAHLLSLPGNLVDVPYALSYTLITAAALHPSVRQISRPAPSSTTSLPQGRLLLVSVALLVPSLLILVWSPSGGIERIGVGVAAGFLSVVAVARVVSSMRRQSAVEARLAHQATHDELTGLPNRSHVVEHLDLLLARARKEDASVALLFLDVDEFKLVNDTLGHIAGDRLLVAVARRLTEIVPDRCLVARLSGDEFVIVGGGYDRGEARRLAERIRVGFAAPITIGVEQYVTVSIGVAVADGVDLDADAASLIRDADTAMYSAKDSGRDAVTVFDVSMRERLTRRLEIEHDLRRAIDDGGLELHYQPIVSLPYGDVETYEALLRWNAPDGPVPPMEFVRVAENSGLIVALGEWVLREACQQLAQWRALPGCADLSVAVNLSARQVADGDIVNMVASALDSHGLPPSALWLEITETVMMEDTLDTLSTLTGLRDLGVALSADDFGTGYSSLSYLKRFPVSQVKIDRSFVAGLHDDEQDEPLVAAIIAMAGALGLSVVAEGVETSEQANRLLALGCGRAQGFYYGAPRPPHEITTVLTHMGHPSVTVPPPPSPVRPETVRESRTSALRHARHPRQR